MVWDKQRQTSIKKNDHFLLGKIWSFLCAPQHQTTVLHIKKRPHIFTIYIYIKTDQFDIPFFSNLFIYFCGYSFNLEFGQKKPKKRSFLYDNGDLGLRVTLNIWNIWKNY